jgi:hypothetical protein
MVIFRTLFVSGFQMLKTRWLPKQDGCQNKMADHTKTGQICPVFEWSKLA